MVVVALVVTAFAIVASAQNASSDSIVATAFTSTVVEEGAPLLGTGTACQLKFPSVGNSAFASLEEAHLGQMVMSECAARGQYPLKTPMHGTLARSTYMRTNNAPTPSPTRQYATPTRQEKKIA